MSNSEKAYMGAAKSVSELSDHPRVHIGAVIVSGHRIISSGCNSNVRTYPLQAKIDSKYFGEECNGKVHAETDALMPFLKRGVRLSGATIYTYRELKNGDRAMARPCPRCMMLIKRAGIRNIVYTTGDGIAKERVE